jgi:uncharacterized Zn-binding protein involved in type VI secretion
MPAVSRLGDATLNAHSCTTNPAIADGETPAGTANVALASGVTANGIAVAVDTSKIEDHTFLSGGSCVPHPSQTVNQGSSTVTVGGKALAYLGATVSCPGTITAGSSSVTVGT